jgi:hypothetical protein
MRRALAFTAIALLASSASAQNGTSAKKAKPLDPISVQAVRNYGKCIVDRTPNGASKVLDMDWRTKGYQAALRRIMQGHTYCMAGGGRLASSGILVAGGMAEAFLTRDKSGVLAEKLTWREGAAPIEARGHMEAVGLCLVRKAPEASASLFGTEPMTSDETAAFRAITPLLSDCVAKGQQLRVNRPGLRAQIALAAYRITHVPASGS